jgi:hypothetical protein
MQVGAVRCFGVQSEGYFADLKGFQVLGKWICQPDFKFFPTAVIFSSSFHRNHGSISKGSWKKSKEREECHCCVAPPSSTSSPSVSVPSAASATSNAEKNIAVAKQQLKRANIHCGSMLQGIKGQGQVKGGRECSLDMWFFP